MQYKILASDYDNTLVPFGESQPRPAVVKAVKKLQASGGKFVLSTGRAWSAINRKGQLGGIRFDYAITCNGACVVDRNGTIVAEHPMTNEEMYALVDFCEDYNYPLQFNFRDAYYAYCEYETLRSCYTQMNSVGLDCVDGEDQDRHLIDMPHAAFCIFPEGALERFHEKYGHLGLHFMQTGGQLPDGSHFYDIVRGGIDKGAGLADLCEKMGLSLAEAVAAGDSANDVGMLKAAGLGCCMSNGTDEAKAAADRIMLKAILLRIKLKSRLESTNLTGLRHLNDVFLRGMGQKATGLVFLIVVKHVMLHLGISSFRIVIIFIFGLIGFPDSLSDHCINHIFLLFIEGIKYLLNCLVIFLRLFFRSLIFLRFGFLLRLLFLGFVVLFGGMINHNVLVISDNGTVF